MRKLPAFLLIFFNYTIILYSQAGEIHTIPGKLKKTLASMRCIEGGTYTMGRHSEFNLTGADTTLLSTILPHRITTTSFFISDHEVTNHEYGSFVQWVADSIKKQMLKKDPNTIIPANLHPKEYMYEYSEGEARYIINIYPDTTTWLYEIPFAYNNPLSAQYFKHQAYKDYPVVGISYKQAQAYCNWKTKRINETVKKLLGSKSNVYIRFRLPTEEEWEYAAIHKQVEDHLVTATGIYPWEGYRYTDLKGKYYANFGPITDANGLMVKSFIDDGAFHTAMVRQYPSNYHGLYDMAGNVAEWTSTIPEDRYILNEKGDTVRFQADDGYTSAYSKAYMFSYNISFPDTTKTGAKQRILEIAAKGVHDAQVIKRYNRGRIVKGGSWYSSLVYIQPGVKEVWNEDRGSCRIGFRVAMDIYQ